MTTSQITSSLTPQPKSVEEVNLPPKNATQLPTQPIINHRTVGLHANSLGFDWKKPADCHKYLVKTGLPEVHAAILNEDWAYAEEILCTEDIGLAWLPTISQRQALKRFNENHTSAWAVQLASGDYATQKRAVIDMAIGLTGITSVVPAGCMYGTNLLTLCLHVQAPANFIRKVIDLSAKHSPAYLSIPDGSGRTPLYIAIERNDKEQVRALLDAGANPLVGCKFTQGETQTIYHLEINKDTDEFFLMLLEKAIPLFTQDGKYSIEKDGLSLMEWVARNDEEAVGTLADRFEILKDALFNFPDKSGTSMVYRKLEKGDPVEGVIVPLIGSAIDKSALHAAAIGAPVAIYVDLLKCLKLGNDADNQHLDASKQTLATFFSKRSVLEITELIYRTDEAGKMARLELMFLMRYLNKLPTEQFISIAKVLWPTLNDDEKNDLFENTARYPDTCFEAVLQLIDCPITETYIGLIQYHAKRNGNKAAWEFAVNRDSYFSSLLKGVWEGENLTLSTYMIEQMLALGSLNSLATSLTTGIHLQQKIDLSGERILPLLADLDPEGLKSRLAGCRLPSDDTILASCKTEQGRQALSELLKAHLALQ